jgi:hypothetical protein
MIVELKNFKNSEGVNYDQEYADAIKGAQLPCRSEPVGGKTER